MGMGDKGSRASDISEKPGIKTRTEIAEAEVEPLPPISEINGSSGTELESVGAELQRVSATLFAEALKGEVEMASGNATINLPTATIEATVGTIEVRGETGQAGVDLKQRAEAGEAQASRRTETVIYISDLLSKRKLKETLLLDFFLLLLLGLWSGFYHDSEHYAFARNVIIIILALVTGDYLCLVWRIKSGAFGNNACEIREMLRFIDENRDNDDLGTGGRKVRLFREAEEEMVIPSGMPVRTGGES